MNSTTLYEETAVTTQNKGRLVVMLYDGTIKFLNQAVKALQAGDLEAKARNIGRAADIILELNTILDLDAGREVAQNLRKLYNFMRSHLNKANISNDIQMIRDVIALLKKLNEGWRAVAV
jgi:flagellar protein FliS